MDIQNHLGVQSYCFRHFKDNAQVARMVRDLGLDAIEICGVHVDFQESETFDAVINTYRDAGVRIVSVGVQMMSDNEKIERNYFEFAKAAGAKYMAVTFGIADVPQAYRTAEKLSQQYDILLAIHNHGGYDWLGNTPSLEHAFHSTNERIGLCLDTAWALDAGAQPLDWCQRFAGRLYGVHIKDFIFDRARRPQDVVVGSGNLDLPALVEVIRTNPQVGYAVLEYEGDVENPIPALTQCVEAVRAA